MASTVAQVVTEFNMIGETTMIKILLITGSAAAVILAPLAHADNGDAANYGIAHGTQLCAGLAADPTFRGIEALAIPTLGGSIEKNDLGLPGMGWAIGVAIHLSCPQFTPLGMAFAHVKPA